MSIPMQLVAIRDTLEGIVAADLTAALAVVDGNVDDIETALAVVDGNVDDIETALAVVDGLVDELIAKQDAGSFVLPDLADDLAVTGAAGAWAEGAYVEVSAALAADSRPIQIQASAVTGLHQVTLAIGAAASEVDLCSIKIPAAGVYDINCPVVAAAERLSIKTASKAGGAQSLDVSIILV